MIKPFTTIFLLGLAILVGACSNTAGSTPEISSPKIDLEGVLSGHGYTAIPLEKLASGHEVITAHINGVEGRFILDTGTSYTVINQEERARFKIPDSAFLRSEEGAGAGGVFEVAYYTPSALTVAGRQLDIPEIGSVDLSTILGGLSGLAGFKISGILGQDVILAQNGILDVVGSTLYLSDTPVNTDCLDTNDNCAPPLTKKFLSSGYTALPLSRLSLGNETIGIAINEEPGLFIIDTGTRTSFMNRDDLNKFNLNAETKTNNTSSTAGAGGGTRIETHEISSFEVQGHALDLQTIGAIDLAAVAEVVMEKSNTDIDGILGQDILTQHFAIMDVPNATLFLYGLSQ